MAKRYICQFCARSFSRSEHKLRHERSHTKEKPFHCSICKNGFVRRDLLQRHLRTVHALVLKTSIEDNISTDDVLLQKTSSSTSNVGSTGSNSLSNAMANTAPSLLNPTSTSNSTSNSTTNSTSTTVGNTISNQNINSTTINHENITDGAQTNSGFQRNNNISLTTEKNLITLITFANKFTNSSLKLNLRNNVSNYIIVFGSHFLLPLPTTYPSPSTASPTPTPTPTDSADAYRHSNQSLRTELPPIFQLETLHSLTDHDEQLYIILCLGACLSNELNDAIILFNKSWHLIIEKISNSKINYNSGDLFCEFVNHLIVLGFIYLNFFISFVNVSKPCARFSVGDQLSLRDMVKKLDIPVDVLFEYLNNIISTHSSSVGSSSSSSSGGGGGSGGANTHPNSNISGNNTPNSEHLDSGTGNTGNTGNSSNGKDKDKDNIKDNGEWARSVLMACNWVRY
ncbi:unnamed protein product [Ambrosiozyma monospora]|uniref:Unnamed protein product n=1 Tax=Ambrosiozyma monospora TaxID=43982 RepID=A0A9W6YW00_AMBMO|nr:unnamed protein product [Ambrosiozyma monospora]